MANKENDMDKFHRDLVEEIEKVGEESPLTGERLVELSKRLDEMILRYMKGQDP
jgi:hypothetical protein